MIRLKVKAQVAAALLALALVLSVSAAQAEPAKNVIFMISDGWGYNQIKATDYYNGTTEAYENFSVKYGMSTYSMGAPQKDPVTGANLYLPPGTPIQPKGYDPSKAWSDFNYVKSGATDSASAASAMATGVKIFDNVLNYDVYGNKLKTIVNVPPRKGRPPASSPRWNSAMPPPRGMYAHNNSRNNYAEIANEMLKGHPSTSLWAPAIPVMTIMGNTSSLLKTIITSAEKLPGTP